MTPGWRDCAVYLLTAARLYLISPPESPKNWGQIISNLNDYHSNPMVISSTFCIPDITDQRRQQEEMHWKYANHSNVACDKFTIIPYNVGLEIRFSFRWEFIGWGQSTTAAVTLREKDFLRQFAQANNGILAGDDPALNTTNTENDSEIKKDAEDSKSHRIANVHDSLEM